MTINVKKKSLCKKRNSSGKSLKMWITVAINNKEQQSLEKGKKVISKNYIIIYQFPVSMTKEITKHTEKQESMSQSEEKYKLIEMFLRKNRH